MAWQLFFSLQAGISCEDQAKVSFLSTMENHRTPSSKVVNLGHLVSLEILINISEIHKEIAFKCCPEQCSINSCKCLWRGKHLKQTGKMDQGPFSPSPLAVLCHGHESSTGTRLPELCSKLSHLSLTPGHLQRLFPSFISRILSQWILRYDQASALASREQCLAWP